MYAHRTPWRLFPDVLIQTSESSVKTHPSYAAAKSGDADAAQDLIMNLFNDMQLDDLRSWARGSSPILVSAHAYESLGVNAIPEVLADELGRRLAWPVDPGVTQTNIVGHTGADGFSRLARQAMFDGAIDRGLDDILVDDFVGMGGTLANLRGHVEFHGGNVLGAIVLTGKPYSARLRLAPERLQELRNKHGDSLEIWWHDRFGHTFDALTESEARYLAKTPDADTIRTRIAQAEQA